MRILLLEGGGMRAAYTNGVLAAWEAAGYDDFDAVYGTSAGGALAAWWTARQAEYALGTWRYAQDRRILSYRRWLTRRGPLLEQDRLFEIIYEQELPLDVAAVEKARHPVVVTVTDADTGRPDYIDIRKGPVLAWLRATGRLPVGSGPAVEVDGRRFLDGGLADPLPVEQAIRAGATQIVAVLNKPRGPRRAQPDVVGRLIARRYPAVAPLVREHHALHNRAVRLLEEPPPGVEVRVVRPGRALGVGRLTRDLGRLEAAIEEGRRDGRAFLQASSSQSTWPAKGPSGLM